MMRGHLLLWICAVVLGLSACSRGPDKDDYFPLGEGHRWTYKLNTVWDDPVMPPVKDAITLHTRGTETIEGLPSARRRSDSGIDYWLRTDDTGIYRVATKGPLDPGPTLDYAPRYVLKKPYAVGTKWESSTTTYLLHRRNEVPREIRHVTRYKAVPMRYEIESVKVNMDMPTGRYSDCIAVLGRAAIKLYVDEMFAWRDVPLVTREWYCPGVGLVKMEREELSPSKFAVGGKVTMVLESWK
jgi:hypothetical protein